MCPALQNVIDLDLVFWCQTLRDKQHYYNLDHTHSNQAQQILLPLLSAASAGDIFVPATSLVAVLPLIIREIGGSIFSSQLPLLRVRFFEVQLGYLW